MGNYIKGENVTLEELRQLLIDKNERVNMFRILLDLNSNSFILQFDHGINLEGLDKYPYKNPELLFDFLMSRLGIDLNLIVDSELKILKRETINGALVETMVDDIIPTFSGNVQPDYIYEKVIGEHGVSYDFISSEEYLNYTSYTFTGFLKITLDKTILDLSETLTYRLSFRDRFWTDGPFVSSGGNVYFFDGVVPNDWYSELELGNRGVGLTSVSTELSRFFITDREKVELELQIQNLESENNLLLIERNNLSLDIERLNINIGDLNKTIGLMNSEIRYLVDSNLILTEEIDNLILTKEALILEKENLLLEVARIEIEIDKLTSNIDYYKEENNLLENSIINLNTEILRLNDLIENMTNIKSDRNESKFYSSIKEVLLNTSIQYGEINLHVKDEQELNGYIENLLVSAKEYINLYTERDFYNESLLNNKEVSELVHSIGMRIASNALKLTKMNINDVYTEVSYTGSLKLVDEWVNKGIKADLDLLKKPVEKVTIRAVNYRDEWC